MRKKILKTKSRKSNVCKLLIGSITLLVLFITVAGIAITDPSYAAEANIEQVSENDQKDKSPLKGYPVYLYLADDLEAYWQLPEESQLIENLPDPFMTTITSSNGRYSFDDLLPGRYIAALGSYVVDGIRYYPPAEMIGNTKTSIEWDNGLLMSFTDVIVVEAGKNVEDINAGLMQSMPTEAGS
jgi:hypothetical protein